MKRGRREVGRGSGRTLSVWVTALWTRFNKGSKALTSSSKRAWSTFPFLIRSCTLMMWEVVLSIADHLAGSERYWDSILAANIGSWA